jgi:diguanylate cyclase (GGDEF)-like protein
LNTSVPVIDRRRAEFADDAIESRYNRHHLPTRIRQLNISLLFCAAFYLAFAATDLTTLGTTTTAFMLLTARVLVALLGVAGCILLRRDDATVAMAVAVACTVEAVGMAVFMVLCWYQPAAAAWNALSLGLMVMAIYINVPNRLIYATLIAVAASIVFTAMVLIQQILRTDDLVAMVLLMLLANALGYIGARRYHLVQREAFRSSLALQQLADRDPLTGCFNRRFLQKGALDAEIVRARRYGTPLAVVLCDIDQFRRLNDTWGDAAGDQVLADFATLLQAMTRDAIDSVIRYGGGAFLLILPETELDGAVRLAERIRTAAAATGTILADGRRIQVSASFGATAIGAAHVHGSAADMLAVADAQLYAAKDAGRDCVRGVVLPAIADRIRA